MILRVTKRSQIGDKSVDLTLEIELPDSGTLTPDVLVAIIQRLAQIELEHRY